MALMVWTLPFPENAPKGTCYRAQALKKNPKGIPSDSPGLLVREKPWIKPSSHSTPKGLRHMIAIAMNLIKRGPREIWKVTFCLTNCTSLLKDVR